MNTRTSRGPQYEVPVKGSNGLWYRTDHNAQSTPIACDMTRRGYQTKDECLQAIKRSLKEVDLSQ